MGFNNGTYIGYFMIRSKMGEIDESRYFLSFSFISLIFCIQLDSFGKSSEPIPIIDITLHITIVGTLLVILYVKHK